MTTHPRHPDGPCAEYQAGHDALPGDGPAEIRAKMRRTPPPGEAGDCACGQGTVGLPFHAKHRCIARTWDDQDADAMTCAEVLEKLDEYRTFGIIDYVLPAEPLSEIVLGVPVLGMVKMHTKAEAIALIVGANAMVRVFAERAGIRL